MSFFVDANIVVYAASDSPYRQPCLDILGAVARGEAVGLTSTAALEEVWHIELSGRLGRLEGMTRRAYSVFAPLLAVTDSTFDRALALPAPGLGANDRLHVATCLEHEIGTIVSADAGFDGAPGLRRVDPLDLRGLRRLLGAPR
ncbi:MAG: type II toxin-antitoxin system VapC family toxin [Thermoleophilia bacterium]|nr:type II toxin-antitoxin system VapC family toxin [Thermoleophilia bacterium]